MGCGSSMETGTIIENTANGTALPQQNDMNPGDIVNEFVRLDVQIGKLEATCPGSRMATAEAWVEHLDGKCNALMGIDSAESKSLVKQNSIEQQQQQQNGHSSTHNLYSNGTSTTTTTAPPVTLNGVGVGVTTGNHDIVANTPSQDLANLALNLGVVSDVHKASTHEDFFANLSESELHLISVRYYTEILDHTKVRLKTLTESFAELNELYINHDGIIALISGGTYMTRLEESLDAQLETARDTRDKLGSALEQWRICGLLLRACANSATMALQQWRKLSNIISSKDKVYSALQYRSTLQASLISLDCAQLALPHVEIKHISNRQILAVKHCNTYMITDIADKARYEHTTKVITAYESNMSKASTWLHDTFNKTLRKDFDKAELVVKQLAKNLRDHREEIFTTART